MTPSICAVVVTFNRKLFLTECLSALVRQTVPINKIYVVDNASTDGTYDYLWERGYLSDSRVAYIGLSSNIGGAGGFYEGIKCAFEGGWDWIWIMDDDAEPHLNAVEMLFAHAYAPDVVGAANAKVDLEGRLLPSHSGQRSRWFDIRSSVVPCVGPSDGYASDVFEIDYSSFVGLAISRVAVKAVGLPRREFFIGLDDVEYCARLRRIGRILLMPSSVIVHKEGSKEKVIRRVFGFTVNRTPLNAYWRMYFFMRNEAILQREYRGRLSAILFITYRLAHLVPGVLIFDDGKRMRLRILARGCTDFLLGRYDNAWALRQRK